MSNQQLQNTPQAEDTALKVRRIEHGTVIDHITAGLAPTVLNILGIGRHWEGVVIVAMNVTSGKLGRKDVVKVEGESLRREDVDKIALIAPNATINMIEDHQLIEKKSVQVPGSVVGLLRCPNSNCVSNHERSATSHFTLLQRTEPVTLLCHYCERIIHQDEIELALELISKP